MKMGYKPAFDDTILTPEHVSWHSFKRELKGPEGINIRFEGSKAKWNCSHRLTRPLTRKILRKYKEIDIEATLKIFETLGGSCDCEVVFNVEARFWETMGGGDLFITTEEKDKH
jgi:hypothetical protein